MRHTIHPGRPSKSKATLRRPRSLAEVAQWSVSFQEFGLHVRDFLHHFRRSPNLESLSQPPQLLVTAFAEGRVADAYLAAMAVDLAHSMKKCPPPWSREPERFCREPWFATPGRHMRATLLLESPGAFRERNLFVSANALSVK